MKVQSHAILELSPFPSQKDRGLEINGFSYWVGTYTFLEPSWRETCGLLIFYLLSWDWTLDSWTPISKYATLLLWTFFCYYFITNGELSAKYKRISALGTLWHCQLLSQPPPLHLKCAGVDIQLGILIYILLRCEFKVIRYGALVVCQGGTLLNVNLVGSRSAFGGF